MSQNKIPTSTKEEEEQVSPNNAPRQQKKRLPWSIIWRLSASLIFPTIIETMDYTIVSTSQARIASYFNSLELQSWIGTGYVLTSTCFLPMFATLADVFGRHIALQISLVFYLIGNVLCCAAQTMPMLIVGRSLAGIGAAGTTTIVRILVSDSSSLDSTNWQSSLLIVLYTIGYTVGPTVGGVLSDVNWRWIFGLKIPICVVSMVLCFLCLRSISKGPQPPRLVQTNMNMRPGYEYNETLSEKLSRVDWLGAFLFVAAGILIILGLNWGSTDDWKSARVIVCIVLSGILFIAFFFFEYWLDHQGQSGKTLMEPMIPPSIFKSYDVIATCIISLASGMVLFCMFYFLGLYFTVVHMKSSTTAGVQLLYFAPGMGAGTVLALYLIKTTRQPKYPLQLGSILYTVGCGILSKFITKNNEGAINGLLVMAGAGVGATFGPVSLQARFSQPTHLVAVIISVQLFFRTFGGTIGLTQLGAVLESTVRDNLSDSSPEALQQIGEALKSISIISQLPENIQELVKDAYAVGIHWCFISLVPWAAIAAIFSLFISNIDESKFDENEENDDIPLSSNNDTVKGSEYYQQQEQEQPKKWYQHLLIYKLFKYISGK